MYSKVGRHQGTSESNVSCTSCPLASISHCLSPSLTSFIFTSLSAFADRSVVVGLLTGSARKQPGLFIFCSVPDSSTTLSHSVLLALITAICERAGETESRTRTCDLLPPLARANHRLCYQLMESGSVKGD